MSNRVVFLDRDGTINVDTGYVGSWSEFELIPGAIAGIGRLQRAGFRPIVVTNQSGIARGYFSQACVDAIHSRLIRVLDEHQIDGAQVLMCPHHPDDQCGCRKPQTGLILAGALTLDINFAESWVIGDKLSDVKFGRNLNTKTALIESRYWSKKDALFAELAPEICCRDLRDAASQILGDPDE